jgi:hypothetical protein
MCHSSYAQAASYSESTLTASRSYTISHNQPEFVKRQRPITSTSIDTI